MLLKGYLGSGSFLLVPYASWLPHHDQFSSAMPLCHEVSIKDQKAVEPLTVDWNC